MNTSIAVTETPAAKIKEIFDAQLNTALTWRTSTCAERIVRLKHLRQAILDEREALFLAFDKDMRKPRAEVTISELMVVLDEIAHTISHLKRWMKPTKVWPTLLTLGNAGSIQYQPKGRCLIIAPWNYPFNLMIGPLVSAIAAGNTAMLKPSEMTPAVSAVLKRIIDHAFHPSEIALVEGGLETSQELLKLPFDHIFFTGSPAVGKVVMAAAAQHLSSVTLELGGKSPTIVDKSADLQRAAETILWGKLVNNGQTCIAPDYLFVHNSVRKEFVQMCIAVIESRYGDTPQKLMASPDLTRVVNQRHAARLAGLLAQAIESGARVLTGGQVDLEQRFIAPTLLDSIPLQSDIMEEEIFGPVLPIIPYSSIDDVISFINNKPKPLALYIWSTDQRITDAVISQTSSGGVCVNHSLLHFGHANLPFGGVNNSGLGNAHGYFGFKAFSHERAVLRGGPINAIKLMFPPYSGFKLRLLEWATQWFSR